MKIKLIMIGKTEEEYLSAGISKFETRVRKYIDFETIIIPSLKNSKSLPVAEQKKVEGELVFKQIKTSDILVLLDEKGDEFTSVSFSKYFQKKMNSGVKNLVFLIGGPYGFSDEIYKRSDEKISLSQLTFSHQMVRLFFMEQVYRALTILKGEPYHHQ